MKQRQTTNQKQPRANQHPPRANQHPLPVQELTEEQLQQVVGGQTGDPCLTTDPGTTQIIVIGG